MNKSQKLAVLYRGKIDDILQDQSTFIGVVNTILEPALYRKVSPISGKMNKKVFTDRAKILPEASFIYDNSKHKLGLPFSHIAGMYKGTDVVIPLEVVGRNYLATTYKVTKVFCDYVVYHNGKRKVVKRKDLLNPLYVLDNKKKVMYSVST
jgi:hypothetical protein